MPVWTLSVSKETEAAARAATPCQAFRSASCTGTKAGHGVPQEDSARLSALMRVAASVCAQGHRHLSSFLTPRFFPRPKEGPVCTRLNSWMSASSVTFSAVTIDANQKFRLSGYGLQGIAA